MAERASQADRAASYDFTNPERMTGSLESMSWWNAGPAGVRTSGPTSARGSLTGKTIDHSVLCTASRHRTCQIVEHLATLNAFLSHARYQLREPPGPGGQLSISNIEDAYPVGSTDKHSKAAAFLHWLLTTHHCVTAFEVNGTFAFYTVSDALRRNTYIKNLRLPEGYVMSDQVWTTIAHLRHLEELEHKACKPCTPELVKSLATLLPSTTSLTRLTIPGIRIHDRYADMVLRALQANTSLKELSLNSSVISDASAACRDEFAGFLKNECRLTALTIVAMGQNSKHCLSLVLGVLLSNKTLLKIDLERFTLDQASVQLLPKVVAENNVIRNFRLGYLDVYQTEYSKAELFNSWSEAFMDNKALEELRLPLSIWEAYHWDLFLHSLSANENMKKVVIDARRREQFILREVYKGPHLSGLTERVSFNRWWFSDGFDMFGYEAFSEFYLSSRRGTGASLKLSDVVQLLPSFTHVTTLKLEVKTRHLNAELSRAITDGIRGAATLKKLCISSCSKARRQQENQRHWEFITQSLSGSTSLVEVDIHVTCLNESCVQNIAEAVKRSRNIRRGTFNLGDATPDFVRSFSCGIEDNYSLVNARLHRDDEGTKPEKYGFIIPLEMRDGIEYHFIGFDELEYEESEDDEEQNDDWFHDTEPKDNCFRVLDTARRNSDLVSRACKFLSGARRDRYCARALEVVSKHPALIAELAEVMSINDVEAAAMVRDATRSLDDMHVFMRVVGVVHERVQCNPPKRRGRKQLVDLNEGCWKAIRRFLKFEDIKDAVPAPSELQSSEKAVNTRPEKAKATGRSERRKRNRRRKRRGACN